jgi:hypothetical protein
VSNPQAEVTISNTGVLSVTAGTGVTVDQPTGNVTVSATPSPPGSVGAGVGVSVSGPPGDVTVSAPVQNNVSFLQILQSVGGPTIFNNAGVLGAVQLATLDADISINPTTPTAILQMNFPANSEWLIIGCATYLDAVGADSVVETSMSSSPTAITGIGPSFSGIVTAYTGPTEGGLNATGWFQSYCFAVFSNVNPTPFSAWLVANSQTAIGIKRNNANFITGILAVRLS